MTTLRSILALLCVSSYALAQPITSPAPAPPPTVPAGDVPAPEAAPLAEIRDEKQIAAALLTITNDPAVQVTDPKIRSLAQALMIEGVKQLQAKAYDQALANFLEAYGKFPSPKILLNIASTLRDMGRPADAANTYQRYLTDPATGPERVAEVKQVLLELDQQLTILTVRVFPSGSDVSIDAGPFIPVGSSLLTRVRPGIHLVRVRKEGGSDEVSINGFEGENKDVTAAIKMDAPALPDPTPPTATATSAAPPAPPPEHVDGWLITGTQYGSSGANANERTVRAGFTGPEVHAIVPRYEISDGGDLLILPKDDDDSIDSGLIAALRIDGEGRGAAGAIGLAISRRRLEAEIMFLRSSSTGGYLGVRYRLFTWWLRPYIGLGVPGFAYDQKDDMGKTSTKLAVGVRAAAGVELKINGHLSVQADVGYEHFFVNQEESGYDANVFVPTVGAIGRL